MTFGLLGPNDAGKTTLIRIRAVYPDLTLEENLSLFGRPMGMDTASLELRTGEV